MTKLAWVFGIVLTIVGILGFVPGITSEGYVLGIFEVNGLHNVIHLVSGIVFLIAVKKSAQATKTTFKVFGVIYALVLVIGLVQGDTVLGLIPVNSADHVLHAAISILALYTGFKKEAVAAAPAM